jgi:hypothetical protein
VWRRRAEAKEVEVVQELSVVGDQGQGALHGLLYGALLATLGPPCTLRFVGTLLADLGQVLWAGGILHMPQAGGALTHQVRAAPQESAGGTPLRGRALGLGEHAAAEQRGNLWGIVLVVFGLPAVPWLAESGRAPGRRGGLRRDTGQRARPR